MSVELPDWLRGMLLLGQTAGGAIVPVLIDAAGQINILVRGVDALGTVRTIRVDNVGQLYAILRGAGGNDVAVDAAGNLAAILKGIDGLGNLRTLLVDASGQAIMVPRGASGNYLDVDALGYLTAVLKGEFGGALTTIAVDLNGRIEAFLMDSEDQWGNTIRVGNAESAARMGSPSVYDWRGQTLYQQTFEHGMGNLVSTLDGVGAAVTVDPVYSLMGGYSLKMLGGSGLGMSAMVQCVLGSVPGNRIGLSVCWSGIPGYDYVTFGIRYSKAGTRYTARIAYETTTGCLGYWTDLGAWSWFAPIGVPIQPYAFNWAKVVMDFNTGTYVRELINSTEHTAVGAMETDALGFAEGIEVEIQVFSVAAFNYGIYLDRFIVTVNEP